MIYKRHYIQFNELVFDEVDMVEEEASSVSFKNYESAYGFTHGSFAPLKFRSGLVSSGSVSLTIKLSMLKIDCAFRPYYRRFAVRELTKAGKLWAVQDNTLIWAHAYITDFSESTDVSGDTLEIDVGFSLPEGVWHKADKQRTFLVPYDPCDFLDCENYKDVNPCRTGDCCNCFKPKKTYCECCDCDDLTKDMALCYMQDRLQDVYSCDGGGFKVIYDCAAGERYFGDFLSDDRLGQRICTDCDGMIAGLLYSDTDIPTKGVKVTLHGQVKNPYIEINGNGNVIMGEYDGTLTVYPDGHVGFSVDECCEEVLPASAWAIPDGMDYGWEVQQGNNRVIIETGMCCGTVCAYIEVDALAI